MNKKVLLVPIQDIINNSVIEQNVDQKILAQTLHMVQDVYLRPILTPSIFNGLIDSVYEFKVNSVELTDTYSGLVEAVKPYLIARTVSEFLIMNNYKISAKGVIKLSDNSGDTADENTVENLKNYYDNLSSRYKQMLLDYLDENNLITEETDIDTTSDSVGWYLGDGENRIYNTNSGNSSTGTAGIDGVSGISGIQGYSGLDGISGISGIQGSNGLSGISGVQGTNGLSGLSGISGLSGVGISGLSGLQGISGLAGGGGTGTNNYIVKWSGTTNTTNSQIYDDGTYLAFNGSTLNFGSVRVKALANGYGLVVHANNNNSIYTQVNGSNLVFSNGGVSTLSGSANLVYSTPSGYHDFQIASYASALRIHNNGNIGVGTTTDAGFKLDVQGKGKFTNGVLINRSQADSDTWIGSVATPYALTIDASTNRVGIGTINPVSKLFIENPGEAAFGVAMYSTNAPGLQISSDADYRSYILFVNGSGGGYCFGTDSTGNIIFNKSVAWSGSNTHILYQNGDFGAAGSGSFGDVNAPVSSAVLSASSTTKGFLPPRMTTTQRDAISTPAAGLMIYNTTTNKHQGYNGSTWNDFY